VAAARWPSSVPLQDCLTESWGANDRVASVAGAYTRARLVPMKGCAGNHIEGQA